MAAIAPAMHISPLSTKPEARIGSVSVSGSEIPANDSWVVNSSVSQPFPEPPHSLGSSMKEHCNPFANWHNYSINNSNSATVTSQDSMPRPPSTMPSMSRTTSTSPSSTEPNNHSTHPATSPYFNAFKPRSKSFAIPALTSCCPNCGLRRPSTVSDQTFASPQPQSSTTKLYQRPYLPSHLHCPDFCPDDVAPYKGAIMPGVPYHARHHRRRRSSLCYAESLVNDAEVIDSGRIPPEVKQDWERQAENIAKKVCLRESRPNSPGRLDEVIHED